MGIVNLTDNSFFSGSRFGGSGAVDAALEMASQGASVIDIGACSSRPGSEPVGPKEEWNRLKGVLKELRDSGIRLSIDTVHSEVVRRVYDLVGDFMVNDISAGEDDPGMLPLVADLGLTYIAMHKRGTSATMGTMTDYPGGVVEGVRSYFEEFSRKAAQIGIRDWILDPGFGFAKTVEQNWELLCGLHALKSLDRPILAGISRKSMIYKPLCITPEEALAPTQVAHLIALQQGATILRVHDVAQAVWTVKLFGLTAQGEQP